MSSWRRIWQALREDRGGLWALAVLIVLILVALFAPVIASTRELSAIAGSNNPSMAGPSGAHWLGTDDIGRDLFAQVVHGARVSLYVGLLATVVAGFVGTVIGLAAGYFRGAPSKLLMALDDFVLVLPFLPLAIVLSVLLGRSPTVLALVIGGTSWAGSARVLRAQVLSIRERGYVDRAKALGASDWQILRRHVLPGVAPVAIANVTLIVPAAILAESTLSFLGFGDRFAPSWGKILDGAQDSGALTLNAWWYYVPPGVCIIAVVLAFTVLGRTLERAFDPRLEARR